MWSGIRRKVFENRRKTAGNLDLTDSDYLRISGHCSSLEDSFLMDAPFLW